ncbi:hypothetical protein [Spirosoma rhododendri]|uniref:Tail protein n=1 Tax=Spirosoma rhododendri TaxID=2728024 RepID=A0A7L5DMD5_9BACT|nr:hypothetical protein [Spirosoma rhododendri]QJD79566.1 hypothetical protein HH216_14945 [Spirosoma rhododendri]
MIGITNDQGLRLELFSNQNLVTEQVAAWLVDDELPGEFSYPIDAPLTENNQRFVAHGYRPDSASPRLIMPVTVSFGGILYRRCQLAYKLQNGKLNAYLKIDSAEVYDKLRKLSLQEALATPIRIGDGVVGAVNGIATVLPLNERLTQVAAAPPGTCAFAVFPIRNETFFEDDWRMKVPGAIPDPQPYVNWFTKTGSNGVGNFVADYQFGDGVVRGYPICPQLYLWWVLEQLMLLAGYRIESDWLAQEAIQRLCILNLTALPIIENKTLDEAFGGRRFIPGQCLPEMDVSEFLKAIKQRFGLCFTFNANTRICTIAQFVGAVAQGPAGNLTSYQAGSYDTAEPDGRGFAVTEYFDPADELYKDARGQTIQPDPIIIGKGGQPISMKVGTCQSIYTDSTVSNGKWQVPTVRQAGNLLDPAYSASDRYLDQTGKRRNNVGLRLLSYEGMQQDSTGAYYPFASTEVCELAGRNGIWLKGLRQYYYFRDQTQRITQKMLLPAPVLSTMQLHRSYSLSLNDRIRRAYLITKLQAEAPGPEGKLTARLECQTIPSGIDQAADVDEAFVYLELVNETQKQLAGPTSSVINANFYDQTKLTVKVWADRNKTRAAIVGKLPVKLRFLKSWPVKKNITQLEAGQVRTVNYLETVTTYDIVGSQMVIEPALKTYLFLTGENVWEEFQLVVQLDPGEGYGIL